MPLRRELCAERTGEFQCSPNQPREYNNIVVDAMVTGQEGRGGIGKMERAGKRDRKWGRKKGRRKGKEKQLSPSWLSLQNPRSATECNETHDSLNDGKFNYSVIIARIFVVATV